MTCAGVTAWRAVVTDGRVKPGDFVVIQGTGGVSVFALQFARIAGATVIAMSSSADKLARLRELGADRAIGRVGHVVYMDATIPRNDESQADVITRSMADAKADSKVIDNILMAVPPGSMIDAMIRGNLKEHGFDWMIDRIRPLPYYGCYESKLVMRNPEAVLKVPTTAIHCLQVPWEQKQYDRMVSCDNFWEIDTVHGLMIGEPEKTAELLLRLGGGLTGEP